MTRRAPIVSETSHSVTRHVNGGAGHGALVHVVFIDRVPTTLITRSGAEVTVAVAVDTDFIPGAAPLIHIRAANADVIDLDPANAEHLAALLLLAAAEAAA